MAEVVRILPATVDEVFAALARPDTFPHWVVGAKRIRGVDGDWPEAGSRFHHTVGMGPIQLRDTTAVTDVDPGRRLVLEARARPMGRAQVELHLEPTAGGTRVRMVEFPLTAPATLVPNLLVEPSIRRRNREALRRLEQVVTGRR